jgi:DNA polymerase-3 subunit alpha
LSVGFGRGPITNSIISYALGITGIDPLKYDLVFEPFLSIEKSGSAEFDGVFASNESEDKIRKYIETIYGSNSMISFFPSCAYSMGNGYLYFRDLINIYYTNDNAERERILELFNNITRRNKRNITLQESFNTVPALMELKKDKKIQKLLSIIPELQMPKSVFFWGGDNGQLTIFSESSIKYIPLRIILSDKKASQYSLKDLNRLGFLTYNLKFSRENHTIETAAENIKKKNPTFNIANIPENDGAALNYLKEDNPLLKKLNLNSLSNLISIYAVLDLRLKKWTDKMIDTINKNHRIKYLHKSLKEVLEETYGIIAYNEQIIGILSKAAGYSLGKSDIIFNLLRGKESIAIEEEKTQFIYNAKKNGFSKSKADRIFDNLRSFAPYTTCKGNIIVEAIQDYQIAYLKTHFGGFYNATEKRKRI